MLPKAAYQIPPEHQMLDKREVTAILKISERTLDRLHNEGRLHKVKQGRRTVWRLADVIAYSESL